MKKALNRFLLILLILSSKAVVSQVDTVFWFASPWITPGHAGNTPVEIRLSSFNNPTTVRVRQPASTFDTTFVIPANSLVSESVSHLISQIENTPANTVLNRGLKITSDFPITVVYEIETVVNNPETYSLKGQNGLGKEFVCPFQTRSNNGPYSPQPKSQICIVAANNNTVIWITPKCNVIGHAANVTYSITLNAGQSYNVENATSATSVAGQNLSGTIIVSDKNISVTVCDDSVGGVGGCYDQMGDQIVSVDIVGNQYVINKGGLNPGENEGGYVVATANFTQITVNDGVTIYTALLNRGDTYYVPISQPLTYITADQPVYVIHASGFGCEMGEAILPPLNCAGSSQVSFTRTNSQTFILNILCKTTAINAFTLNGSTTLVPASQFTVVPGTSGTLSGFQRSYTTAEIPAGIANLITNSTDVFSMGVINGGASSGCLYHYMSSFLRKTFTVADPDKNICTATTTLSLNGSISGGSTTGIWTTSGTGAFGNPNNLVTTYSLSANDLNQSQIRLILSSTGNCTPVMDTVYVNIFKSPIVDANNGLTLCKNNISPIALTGTLQFAAGASWSSSGTGSFGNPGSLNTTYLPSPADLAVNTIKIKLTSTGSLNGCPNTYDTLMVNFINAPVVMTSGDVSVCANNPTVAITGTVSAGTFTTGVWTTTGSGLFSPSTTSLSTVYQLSPADITQGNLVIKLTSTNVGNCNAVSETLTITVTPKPNVDAGLNDTICSSNIFYPLNGSVTGGASAGIWTSLGNGTIMNPNNLSTVYTLGQNDTLNGKVKLILTSVGSNCLPERDTITVIIAKSPLVNAGADNAVCDNQLIPLNGSVVGLTTTGAWTTLGTGGFTPDDSLLVTYYQPSPLDVSSGFVRLILTSTYNKGCAAIHDTVKLSFKPAPVADYNADNSCAKKQANFADNSTSSSGSVITGWSWNYGDLGTSISQNGNHVYTNPGTYTVTHVVFSNNGCKDTIQKPFEVYFLPQAMFYQNTPCVGNATQFVDSSKTQSGSLIAWNWSFGDNATSGIQNPTHAYAAADNYTVVLKVTSSFGCENILTKQITVIPGPTANFAVVPNPLEALETGNFTDQSTGPSSLVSWYWDFGDESASNSQNTQHAYSVPGDYTVNLSVKDINGCIADTTKDITVVLMPDVPTAFSPNGDSQNDFFRVRGGPFKTITVRVYNNWGQLIFETNDQMEGWNGTFNGTEQPVGVYVWVVDVEMLNGKVIKKTGDVTLLR